MVVKTGKVRVKAKEMKCKINHWGTIYEIDYGSKEFGEAKKAFFDRLNECAEKKSDKIKPGVVGALVGEATKDLQFPFNCPSLEIRMWSPLFSGEPYSVAYFCNEMGCLCSPCREELQEDLAEQEEGRPWSCPNRAEYEAEIACAFDEREFEEGEEGD